MFSFLNVFRIIAFLEGVSYVLLLFIATPLKYFFNEPQYTKILGMPHGLLFLAYIILTFMLRNEFKWEPRKVGVILMAAIIPFGTFYVDRKYFKTLSNG